MKKFRKFIFSSCDTWLPNGNPHPDNTRETARKVFENETVVNEKPMFGIEQEFFYSTTTVRPLGFPASGYPLLQGPYY